MFFYYLYYTPPARYRLMVLCKTQFLYLYTASYKTTRLMMSFTHEYRRACIYFCPSTVSVTSGCRWGERAVFSGTVATQLNLISLNLLSILQCIKVIKVMHYLPTMISVHNWDHMNSIYNLIMFCRNWQHTEYKPSLER